MIISFLKRKVDLEAEIEQANQAEDNVADIERFCQIVKQNLADFTFENKRLALEALNIRVHLDVSNIRIEGAIPIATSSDIVSNRLGLI